jgi:integrase
VRRGRLPENLARTFFLICALVGERPEAILSLRWRNIEGDVLFFETTKTKREGRRVPVVPAVREALEKLYAAAPAPPDGYIFDCGDGSRCTQSWYSTRFTAAMKAAGLPPLDAEGRKRVPYSFQALSYYAFNR